MSSDYLEPEKVTRLRIWRDDDNEWTGYPWAVDGTDCPGVHVHNRDYTEWVEYYLTWKEAVDALPEIARQFPRLGRPLVVADLTEILEQTRTPLNPIAPLWKDR